MKKGFTTFLSALKANTPPCKKGLSSHRFLSLFLILFLAVGNAWGQLTAHAPGVYEKTVAEGGYGCTLTTVATGENAGVFEVYYFSANSKYGNTTDLYEGESKQQYRLMCADDDSEYQLINTSSTSAFTKSCDWIEMAYTKTGFSKSDYTYSSAFNEFFAITPNGGNTNNTKTCFIKPKEGDVLTLKVSGYVEFAILGADNGSSKYMTITVDGGTPTSWKSNTLSRRSVELTTGEHTIVVANVGTSANNFYGFSLKLPSCDATAPGNISKGALVAGELTLTAAGSPADKNVWYWQSSATGEDKTLSGASRTVSAAGTYYVRSLYDDDCWSDAKSFEVKTTDLVANYTVIYKDGATELDRETVEVGNAPAGITAPTKDCYTFAGWDPALNTVSGNEGDEIEVNATWTANYSTSATLISDDVVSGKPNVNTVFAASNIVSSITFASSNYEFTNNETKKGYYGYKDKQSGDNMKILVQQGKQVQVLFGNLGSDPTITANGVAQSLDASRATGDNAENTFTYTASAADALISITMGSGTNTLKKIDIYSLYNATYTDGKGDASGSDENVTEVTLPTPTETTVDGYSFTGWVADKTVYKGETEKTAGSGLNAGETYTLTANTTFTAQWALIADFDVKFFQGYGDPDVQIGETQSISTGGHAVAPTNPTRAGFAFLGWSYDGTEAHIVDVATYGITAATNFTAMWKAVWTVTFDGAGNVEVENGETVASPNSPVQPGKVFQGWYNDENKYDFSSAITGNLALTSKWAVANPNHYVYAYNDDFHFDGVVYKTPEGAVDGGSGTSNIPMTTPYTLFAGDEGITSIVMTDGIYDSKTGAIQAVTALMKVNNNATSKLTVTIKSGYTATLKIKSSGYSATRTINVSDATPASGTTTGQAVTSGAMSVSGIGELSFALTSGSHDLTVTGGTLYIAELDIEATALPVHTVTYMPGEGSGAESIIDDDATEVRDGSTMFTAPEGKIFNGWKDESDNDVEVGAIVSADMALTAQWINHYAVTFNLQGHGDAIDPQDIIEGGKVTKPADPVAIGYDFGGWYTEAECTNVWDFATVLTGNITLYAKWTEFEGCFLFVPKSVSTEESITAGSDLETTMGGKLSATNGTFSYNPLGLLVAGNSSTYVTVTLDNNLAEGTKITVLLAAGGTNERGLNLRAATDGDNIYQMKWTPSAVGEEKELEYTVNSESALKDKNVFYLYRNNNVYLKSIKITNCGGKIVSVNYAITPTEAADKATVTLSANTSVEGQTITATYSNIASGWDFDKWEVNGATMDDAQANPVTITLGAENPTVTLVLKPGAIKYTVSFDAQGGSAVESQFVEEKGNPILPAEPTKEDYIFKGWAEEVDGDAVDVTLFTITAPKTFYAIWESDGAIKLLDKTTGAINTTDFITGVSANDNIDGEKGATWGGTQGSISGANALNKVVQYNAKTNKTKIQVSFYNKNSGDKVVYLHKIVEGETTAVVETLTVAKKSRYTSEYYEFNNEKNRSIYLTTNSTDVQILQVKVIESGETTLRNAGQVGYSLNLKKGRVLAYSGTEIVFEGLKLKTSSNYSVIYSEELQIKSNLSFSIESPVLLRVETNAAKYYVSQNAEEDGTTATAVTETGTKEFNLGTTGTWYIVPSTSSAVKLTNIAFEAPKCDAPVFNALANSDICSGDPYVALDGTATVSDGTVTYKWYAEGADESDPAAVLGTDAKYTPGADGAYYVVATNSLAGYTDNVVQSEVVTVTTHTGAAISEGLVNQRGVVDDVVTLTVTASGKDLHYTWKECATIGGTYTDVAGAADAASLDVTITEGLSKYYKVIVHSDCGEDQESIAKVEQFVPVVQQNVTGSTVWDWTKAASVNEIKLTDATTPKKNEGFVMANGAATVYNNANFESDKLYLEGEYIIRTVDGKKLFQGKTIKFNTTVAGAVRVTFSHTGSEKPARELFINGVGTGTSVTGISQTETGLIEVPAGEVAITAFHVNPTDGAGQQYVRVYKIEFLALGYTRDVNVGELATVCLPNACVARDVEVYELVGKEPQYGKIVFDEILSGELMAGKPYLLRVTNPKAKFYYTVDAPAAEPDNSGAMKGTFEDITLTNLTNIYYFAQKALWSCVDLTSLSVPANRAYVKMDEMPEYTESNPAPGRRRITLGVNGQQVATGVDQVQGEEVPTKMIINGQLFILRGEKMYDAQGKLVK